MFIFSFCHVCLTSNSSKMLFGWRQPNWDGREVLVCAGGCGRSGWCVCFHHDSQGLGRGSLLAKEYGSWLLTWPSLALLWQEYYDASRLHPVPLLARAVLWAPFHCGIQVEWSSCCLTVFALQFCLSPGPFAAESVLLWQLAMSVLPEHPGNLEPCCPSHAKFEDT